MYVCKDTILNRYKTCRFEDPHVRQVLILAILGHLHVLGLIFLPRNVYKQVLILTFWVVLAKIAKFSTHLK